MPDLPGEVAADTVEGSPKMSYEDALLRVATLQAGVHGAKECLRDVRARDRELSNAGSWIMGTSTSMPMWNTVQAPPRRNPTQEKAIALKEQLIRTLESELERLAMRVIPFAGTEEQEKGEDNFEKLPKFATQAPVADVSVREVHQLHPSLQATSSLIGNALGPISAGNAVTLTPQAHWGSLTNMVQITRPKKTLLQKLGEAVKIKFE